MPSRRVTDVLFFAAIFAMSFEQLYWNVAGKITLAEVLSILFVAAYVLRRFALYRGGVVRTSLVVVAFFGLFLLVYLVGFFNLETTQGLSQFGKGLGKFFLHFAFLAAAIDYLARSTERMYWRTLGWFCAGAAANGLYGLLALAAARSGHNLNATFIEPLTGHSAQVNIYGAVNGSNVYRVNGLTGDPNHLGIQLIAPLLILGPIYLRLERGHRLKLPLGLLLSGLLVVELATLSRSAALGLIVGFLVLLIPYRHLIFSRAMLGPLAIAFLVVAYEVHRRPHFFHAVIASRLKRGGRSTGGHFQVYDFIPHVLHTHPLFGLGFNNFSVYYQFVTGKTNWGPHSFYVAVIVETGLVGALLFATFIVYLFRRLSVARAIGRALAAVRDPLAARIRPLAWGLTAALAGTLAANAFYLTMISFYFYALVLLMLAVPVVFARRLQA
jgi:O-Antigen ligase